jgi:hypothetical protein
MNVTNVMWGNHKAVKITGNDCEMIISISFGPRIVSLRRPEGDNLLYEDTTGFGVGAWRLYGGHRFTIGPESEASYYPDNVSCSVNQAGGVLVISAPTRNDDLRLSIKVSESSRGCGFELLHILENYSSKTWSGALWAITCIPRSANIAGYCDKNPIIYWPGTVVSNWTITDGLLALKGGEFRGKAGWHMNEGWISATQAQTKLTIYHGETTTTADCVDGGCNLEVFVCKDWIELETLGKAVAVLPGELAQHTQHWLLTSNNS